MRIAVIGAGAIGSVIAAEIARAGADITLVARGSRLDALRTGPVSLASTSSNGTGRNDAVRVTTVAIHDLAAPVDLAICCVKVPALAGVLADLAGKLAPDGAVLTLQNGVEAHDIAAECLPTATILAGRVHGFFEMDGDTARHVGVPPSIRFGCTHRPAQAAEHRVTEAFASSTISTEPCANIRQALWEKFMLAACLGSVGSALGLPAGQVCASTQARTLLRGAMEEVAALARTTGIDLSDADIDASIAFAESFPANATTSLQRDLDSGRPSEYDALTGAVAHIARTHGFHADVFTRIEAMIARRMAGRI